MLLILDNGRPVRGDLVVSAVVRYDLAPVPATLEAEIRLDDDMESRLATNKTLSLANGDVMRIIKSVRTSGRAAQGQREMATMRVVALLDACHQVAFVRARAIIKESTPLSGLYWAAGASLRAVDADFPVQRFYCLTGDTPSYQIARVLQEEGGAVRWKNGRLQFMRLQDFFSQKPVMNLPGNASDDTDSGFLERHEVPTFFSVRDDATLVHGNRDKPRTVRFAPHKNELKLRNLTRVLVHRKVCKIALNARLMAGDLVQFAGGGTLLVVTVAHVFQSGTDGAGVNTYSRLWLSSLEE